MPSTSCSRVSTPATKWPACPAPTTRVLSRKLALGLTEHTNGRHAVSMIPANNVVSPATPRPQKPCGNTVNTRSSNASAETTADQVRTTS